MNTDAELKKFLDPLLSTNDTDTLNASDGVIKVFTYNGDGYRTDVKVKKGRTGSLNYVSAKTWGDGIVDDEPKWVVTETYTYPTQTATKSNGKKTTYEYDFHDDDDTKIETIKTTLPKIPVAQNGSNISTVTREYYDEQGRLRWTKDGEGFVNYYSYHEHLGRQSYIMRDVDTASLDTEITADNKPEWLPWTTGVPTNFTRDSGLPTAIELVNKTEFDDQGRRIKSIDPGGAEHYVVYDDNMTMRFKYWDDVADEPLLPIEVTERNDAGQVIELYTVDPAETAVDGGGQPTGLSGTVGQGDYVTWKKITYGDFGERTQFDVYHDIPSSGNGTLSTNFNRTILQYDDEGRVEYTIDVVSGTSTSSSVEQVTQNIYDFLSRSIEVKNGVSSTSHNMGSTYATKPTMTTVSKTEIDDAGVGDNNVTKRQRFHGTGANDYTGSNTHYDWRNRVRGNESIYHNGTSEAAIGPYLVQDRDWTGQVIASAVYDTNPTWSTVIGDQDYADTIATNRRALKSQLYDDLGRIYKTEIHTITASTGAKGNKAIKNKYYDRIGQPIASEQVNGSAMEIAFDGVGRPYQVRTVIELEATKFTSGTFNYRAPEPDPALSSMTGADDKVIQFNHTEFDSTSTLPTKRYSLELNHDDTDGMDFTNDDDYIITYAYTWYDDADRMTDTVNYGTATTSWKYNATAPTYGASAPARSDTELVTSSEYDSVLGRAIKVTDPAGTITRTWFDDTGRQTYVAENYVNFVASTEANTGGTDTSEDRVTKFEYHALSQTVFTALDADGNGNLSDNQATTYLYEDAVNAYLQTNIIYPDSSDTTSSGSDQVKVEYNLDGSLKKKTDHLGTVIDYTYNNRRKLDLQKVTTLGTGVDGHVRSIKRAYDDLGRPDTVSSYANSDGTGTIRNQIVKEFNDFGQITKHWQSHEGAKTGSTLNVQYAYDLTSDGNSVYDDGARLNQVTYPDGRVTNYDYGTSGGLDDLLSRLSIIKDGSSNNLVSYLYNGLGTLVGADLEQIDLKLNYYQDDDKDYEGFDRFGRIIDQWWDGYGSMVDSDRFHYAYDRNSNRTYRDIDAAIYATNDKDQAYTFDGLDRLLTFDVGTLSGSTISGTPALERDFTLDQLGNWATFIEKTSGTTDLDQDRTHNDANEITAITETTGPSWIDPVTDASGNMTEGPTPGSETVKQKYVYDAWNRLVKVTDASDVSLGEYEYDGLNRRIVKKTYSGGTLDDTFDYYFNDSWQIVEIRLDADVDPFKQIIWHDYYIDAALLMFHDNDVNGSTLTLYSTHDANFNRTTEVADYDFGTGVVILHYEYDAYGQVSFLDHLYASIAEYFTKEGESYFAGYRFDPETELYQVRNRQYHAALGRFLQRDPAGYIDGLSLYEYARSSPINLTDPSGLYSRCISYETREEVSCGGNGGGRDDDDDQDDQDDQDNQYEWPWDPSTDPYTPEGREFWDSSCVGNAMDQYFKDEEQCRQTQNQAACETIDLLIESIEDSFNATSQCVQLARDEFFTCLDEADGMRDTANCLLIFEQQVKECQIEIRPLLDLLRDLKDELNCGEPPPQQQIDECEQRAFENWYRRMQECADGMDGRREIS